jgi:hypothetical protein
MIKTPAIVVLTLGAALTLRAQGQGGPPPVAPPAPRAAAPIDLTGNWVSVVTEDWRWRMLTPAKGDYASIPITRAAQMVADGWDPAADERSGEQCRAYGMPGLMRMPTRLRIQWTDDTTLKVDADAGTQTRLLHFGAVPAGSAPSWQGDSLAVWEIAGRGGPPAAGRGGTPAPRFGSLAIVTRNLRPGYLRKNGVPYSANATVREYWEVHAVPGGDTWLVDTMTVTDPQYLQMDWITSVNFKKEPDGSKWDPSPCSTR